MLTFRVPTESDTASTTGLKVQFPAGQPLAFTSVKPKAGWTYTVTKAKLASPVPGEGGDITEATSVIEWTAASPTAGIKPGEFDEFQVSAGPLPEAESMTFKAVQTYSDGKVVSWIEEPAAGRRGAGVPGADPPAGRPGGAGRRRDRDRGTAGDGGRRLRRGQQGLGDRGVPARRRRPAGRAGRARPGSVRPARAGLPLRSPPERQ